MFHPAMEEVTEILAMKIQGTYNISIDLVVLIGILFYKRSAHQDDQPVARGYTTSNQFFFPSIFPVAF